MDVKVDVSNVLPGNHAALENAAIWLRGYLQVPENCTIIEHFEEYFNCRVDIGDRMDYWMEPDKVVFESNAELMLFVLKWC